MFRLPLLLSLAYLFAGTVALAADCVPCREFGRLNTAVRDGEIDRYAARDRIRELVPQLAEFYRRTGAKLYGKGEWRFPVQGYTPRTAGNRLGRDYVASGYDYFKGNRHGGHPSFDLFIQDRNQDNLDDRTGQPVNVLAMTGGLVVAAENDWTPTSHLRGGKYLWIFDPATEALIYYAHNSSLLVQVGDLVKPGDAIATVGRTGLNAYKRRSPTHLHLTYLKIKDGYPRPEKLSWTWLAK